MKVDFGIIRYANCWEDADILLNGLQIKEGSRVLSIASAGDNSFSLLCTHPAEVTAVDISQILLFLVELKKIAIINLEQEEFLGFIGIKASMVRKQQYQLFRPSLSKEAYAYWDKNIHLIESGLVFAGKFEKYFALFRNWILPFIHSKKNIDKLIVPKSAEEQAEFYSKIWNTKRWKLLFSLFFNKYVMGKYGRDPAFLEQVNVPVSDFIYSKAAKQLSSTLAQENYFLKMILTGNYGNELPHYVRPENYKKIKDNIHYLHIKQGFVQDVLNPDYSYFNLSNIFEYMPVEVFKACVQNFNEKSPKGSRFAYWNLMVPRSLSNTFSDIYKQDTISEQLTNIDKGFFYNTFIIDQKM